MKDEYLKYDNDKRLYNNKNYLYNNNKYPIDIKEYKNNYINYDNSNTIVDYGKIIQTLTPQQLKNLKDLLTKKISSDPKDNAQKPIQNVSVQPDNSQMVIDENIAGFLDDMFNVTQNQDFRGWILPNGKLMSQFRQTNSAFSRKDHGALVKIFIDGLKVYNFDLYNEIIKKYEEYKNEQYGRSTISDVSESFAVDVLGWMQVSFQGSKRIIAQATNEQNKYLRPFILNYGFTLEPRPQRGYVNSLDSLYENIMQIIKLGLEAQDNNKMIR